MANIKSQEKRIKITAGENARNSAKKTKVKNTLKKFNATIDAGDIAAAEAMLPGVESVIMSAAADGIYKANTASRKVAGLYSAIKRAKAATTEA